MLVAESRVTLIDALLAGSVLVGLALNAGPGWWWADPLAGMVIVFDGPRRVPPHHNLTFAQEPDDSEQQH